MTRCSGTHERPVSGCRRPAQAKSRICSSSGAWRKAPTDGVRTRRAGNATAAVRWQTIARRPFSVGRCRLGPSPSDLPGGPQDMLANASGECPLHRDLARVHTVTSPALVHSPRIERRLMPRPGLAAVGIVHTASRASPPESACVRESRRSIKSHPYAATTSAGCNDPHHFSNALCGVRHEEDDQRHHRQVERLRLANGIAIALACVANSASARVPSRVRANDSCASDGLIPAMLPRLAAFCQPSP